MQKVIGINHVLLKINERGQDTYRYALDFEKIN